MRHIISRTEWGATRKNGFHNRTLPARLLGLHHSVTIAPDLVQPFDDDYAAVRTLEEIGENRFNGGISYTWIITPAGLIFEGHSPQRSGSHTYNLNDSASAICWVGDYSKNKPSEELIVATAWLVVHAWRQGWIDEPRIDSGHGGLPGQATDCPGEYARAALARVNELAAQYAAGHIDLEDDMPSAKEVVDELLKRRVHFRIPSDTDPRGYTETSEELASVFAGLYGHTFWGLIVGSEMPWGPGIARQLQTLTSRSVADLDEDALADELAKRGVGGANVTQVKEALAEVLGGTRLTPPSVKP